jgi:hypothetical protein
MGSPISGIIAEVYLQHMEELYIKHWLESGDMIYNKRYVDDILIIFNHNKTNETSITNVMNRINHGLEFKATPETNKAINYLDITITRNTHNIEINIYRKPTDTGVTIHNTSNHPGEHKKAAFIYHINRMLTLPITEQAKKQEWHNICKFAQKKMVIHKKQ